MGQQRYINMHSVCHLYPKLEDASVKVGGFSLSGEDILFTRKEKAWGNFWMCESFQSKMGGG